MKRIGHWLRLRAPYLFIVVAMAWTLHVQSNQIDKASAESKRRDNHDRVEAYNRDHQICLAGNDFRANDLASWEYVLAHIRPSPDTVKFHRYVAKKDRLRNCDVLVPKPEVSS